MGYGKEHHKSKRNLIINEIITMAKEGVRITNATICSRIAVSRETARNYLRALYENKYLTKRDGCFVCVNPDGLESFDQVIRRTAKSWKKVKSEAETCIPKDLPPVGKTLEDLLAYVKELEDRVVFLEDENKDLYKQFTNIHQALANAAYNPRVALPAMPDHS